MKRDEYARRWPNYCRNCDGFGYFVDHFDPSPSGVALGAGTIPLMDPCSACMEYGVCPRCGQEHGEESSFTEGEMACEACAWDHDEPDGVEPE